MTTNFHTDIPLTATDDVSFINAPLGQLDLALTNFQAGAVGSPLSRLLLNSTGAKTLSTDTLDVANLSFVTVSAETGTADNLLTLVNPVAGAIYILQAASGHTITIKASGTNIALNSNSDIVLSGNKQVMLFYSPLGFATDLSQTQAATINTQRTVLSASAGSVTISNIPATYKHLQLWLEMRSDLAATLDSIILRFNGDATAANYYSQYASCFNTTSASSEFLGATKTGCFIGSASAANTSPANENGFVCIDIPNYASVALQRHVQFRGGVKLANTTGNLRTAWGSAWWTNIVAAINSITILPDGGANFVAGSAYTLYGWN